MSSRAAAVTDAAPTLLRLAVLLQAGIAPTRAWEHLAAQGDPQARAVSRAADVVQGMEDAGPAWHPAATAWRIATTVGAPLAETLRAMAHALEDARACADDVRVALAEPAASSRLMAWLPVVGLALAAALGFDVLHAFVGNPIGIACLIAGGVLIFTARRWSARLVRTAQPPPGIPGLDADLLAVALAGGVSIERATALVRDGGIESEPQTRRVLALSAAAGVPAVELLRAQAGFERQRSRTEGRMRAARLSSALLLPLGVCTLPAFLCWGVAPLMLSVMVGTGASP